MKFRTIIIIGVGTALTALSVAAPAASTGASDADKADADKADTGKANANTATEATVTAAAAHRYDVVVTVTGLRSEKGQILACLAASRDEFPDCNAGKDAGKDRAIAVPAHEGQSFRFHGVPDGRYAIALLHDENGNGKIDKALMIPREGFGFSQNAPLRMGPPAFKDAAFTVDDGDASQSIRMRYIM